MPQLGVHVCRRGSEVLLWLLESVLVVLVVVVGLVVLLVVAFVLSGEAV